jgi:hypothetical protein
MIGWNTTEKEEPESWFFYLQRLLRFNPIDHTRVRLHVHIPDKYVVEEDRGTHVEEQLYTIKDWETDIVKVRIALLKKKFDKLFIQKESHENVINKSEEKIKNFKAEWVKLKKDYKKQFSTDADDEEEDDKLDPVKKSAKKKIKEARKSYKATQFESEILPKRQIGIIEEELKQIVLEVRTLQTLKSKEPIPTGDEIETKFGKLKHSELSQFINEYKLKRNRFDPEKADSPDGSINAKFTEDEKNKLADVEYAIRTAISLGSYTELTTIPEIELFGSKKKEWEDLEKKREKIKDKISEKRKEREQEQEKLQKDEDAPAIPSEISDKEISDREIDALRIEIAKLEKKFEGYRNDHKSRFKQEMPVDTMTEYIRIKIERGSRPQEYFFTLYFEDSCRKSKDYNDQAAFDNDDKELGNLSDNKSDEIRAKLSGLSLKTYVKRKFFQNNKKEFEETFEPPLPKDTAYEEEIKKPETDEDKKKFEERRLEKIHAFCASKCADRLEDYVFRGSFTQHVKDISLVECSPTGYDWLMADCLNTIDFVPYILKCELIIYLGCINEHALLIGNQEEENSIISFIITLIELFLNLREMRINLIKEISSRIG